MSTGTSKSSIFEPHELHELFIHYLKTDYLDDVMQLIQQEDFDIHHIFKIYEFELNAFQVVCFEIYLKLEIKQAPISQYVKCAKLLLDNGVDIRYCDPDYQFEAIQFAVMTGQIDLVDYTIQRYEQDDISIINYDLITQLITFSIDEGGMSQDYLQLIEYLINKKVNVNNFDLDRGEPPIYMAAKMKYKSLIKLMLDMRPYAIDLDFYIDKNGKTARNLIEKYHLYDGMLPKPHSLINYSLYKAMYDLLAFIKEYKGYKLEMGFDQKVYLMSRAVDLGLHDVFEHILEDVPKELVNYNVLLRTVCRRGCYRILKILLKYPRVSYNESIVEELVGLKYTENDLNADRSTNKCLELLLQNRNLNLNLLNKNNNSLLEIALKYGHEDMVLTLLNYGASFLKCVNGSCECLIDFVPPDLVKTYLDSCVSKISKQFKYGKLYEEEMIDTSVSTVDYTINLTSFLMPRNPEVIEFDKPVVKPENIKLKSIYVQELLVCETLSKNPKYTHLLTHPFITVFLSMKWHKVRWFFYTDLILYLLYALLTNVFIYYTKSLVCLGFLIAVVFLTEAWQYLQLTIHGLNQLYVFENWYKLLLFVLSLTQVIKFFSNYHSGESQLPISNNRQLDACVSLVSITNIFFASGYIPYFSTSVIMIKSIYNTIFESFIHYTFLLLAFATTFYVLFKDSYSKYFGNYMTAVFKTVLMASGEYDTYNLGLLPFPDVSYFVLLFFVALISLGLLNFLTGLSVGNINKVKKNAEIFGQIVRIENMARIEDLIYKGGKRNSGFAQYICLFPLNTCETVIQIDTKHRHIHFFRPAHTIFPIENSIVNMLKMYAYRVKLY